MLNSISKPTVAVLLSTYNGHKYLKELVDSVLAQKDVDIILQVRDDGSSDDTIEILKSYNDPRISIKAGKNIKPAKSFLKLLKECDDADYYAYCDQDDVWYPYKLITAIKELKNINAPCLFISTYDVVDKELNKLFTYDMKFEEKLRIQDVIIYRAPSACNMVFNHALRETINKSNPKAARMHDYWTLLVTLSHNYKVITNNAPLIMYRQHDDESVGIIPNLPTRIKRLYKSLKYGNNERWRQAKELYTYYSNDMDKESFDILNEIVNYRSHFSNRLKLIKDRRFKTSSIYINLLFKTSVLFGKF